MGLKTLSSKIPCGCVMSARRRRRSWNTPEQMAIYLVTGYIALRAERFMAHFSNERNLHKAIHSTMGREFRFILTALLNMNLQVTTVAIQGGGRSCFSRGFNTLVQPWYEVLFTSGSGVQLSTVHRKVWKSALFQSKYDQCGHFWLGRFDDLLP